MLSHNCNVIGHTNPGAVYFTIIAGIVTQIFVHQLIGMLHKQSKTSSNASMYVVNLYHGIN